MKFGKRTMKRGAVIFLAAFFTDFAIAGSFFFDRLEQLFHILLAWNGFCGLSVEHPGIQTRENKKSRQKDYGSPFHGSFPEFHFGFI